MTKPLTLTTSKTLIANDSYYSLLFFQSQSGIPTHCVAQVHSRLWCKLHNEVNHAGLQEQVVEHELEEDQNEAWNHHQVLRIQVLHDDDRDYQVKLPAQEHNQRLDPQ